LISARTVGFANPAAVIAARWSCALACSARVRGSSFGSWSLGPLGPLHLGVRDPRGGLGGIDPGAPRRHHRSPRPREPRDPAWHAPAALLRTWRCGDTSALAPALEGFEDGAETLDQIEARALLGHRDS
jgi:hypothetical protein